MRTPIITSILINKFEVHSLNLLKRHIKDINIDYSLPINSLNIFLDKSKSFHEYTSETDVIVVNAISNIKNGKIKKLLQNIFPKQNIENIDEMNEICIFSINSEIGDNILEYNHTDGPFFLLPWCNVYKCCLAIIGNDNIHTEFTTTDDIISLQTKEFVLFDYNKHSYYTWQNNYIENYDHRVILQFHYLITPDFLPTTIKNIYKNLHVNHHRMVRYMSNFIQEKNLGFISLHKISQIFSFLFHYINFWKCFFIFLYTLTVSSKIFFTKN
jgi:hypothetical protein